MYDGHRLNLRAGGELLFKAKREEVEIAARLSNTIRRIELPSGAAFETDDNDGVDRLAAAIDPSPLAGLVHRLESRTHYIFLSLLLVVGVAWWFVAYALPWSAEKVAFRIPASVLRQINQESLGLMEGEWLKPSKLPEARQRELLRRFANDLQGTVGQAPDILFRDSEAMGANAFALPPNTVVFTDQLVKLAQKDEELSAILFHEVGHLEARHGLRQTIQNSALSLITVFVFGDVSSITDLGIGLPMVLTELGYSRGFEREADAYALRQLRQKGIPPSHFANILVRLEKQALCEAGKATGKDCAQQGRAIHPIFHYLSTHPDTQERIAAFRD